MTSPPVEKLKNALADRYEIIREIGAGGMATVYLARDLRHDRDVALKLLKPELGAVLGPERFLSEIRVTAKLQHPNLLPLFDSGETDGQLWYVMPYVEGVSLRARMERERQLPVREAVRLASAIASALDYAHRHGVIHRDLKPENILLHEDQPLVADFGIALAVSNAGGERVTQTGLSLGTPQYMSPEQATGERGVDGRTDIYSLGAVLYEMLTGEPPHTGATVQAIIARVITDTPRSVRATRSSVPENVDLAIQKALEKVPADRFETAKEFAEVLQGQKPITGARTVPVVPDYASVQPVDPRHLPGRRKSDFQRDSLPWIVAGAAVLLAALAGFGWRAARSGGAGDPEPVMFAVTPVAGEIFSPDYLALSPDGRKLVYVGVTDRGQQLYIRSMDDLDARPVAGTQSGEYPAFSPDGKWLAFFANGDLLRIPIEGGTPITIARNLLPEPAPWWLKDNRIIIPTQSMTRQRAGFSEVLASGGVPKAILVSDTAHRENVRSGVETGDGHFLFTSLGPGGIEDDFLALGTFGSSKYTVTDLPVSRALAFVDGHCICLQFDGTQGNIVAVPMDLKAQKINGDPITLRAGLGAQLAVALSGSGTLAYVNGSPGAQIVLVNAAGKEDTVLAEVRGYRSVRLSPNGKMIAMWLPGGTLGDVWVYDIAAKTLSKLSQLSGSWPEWSPDSKKLVYVRSTTAAAGIYTQPVDGSAPPEHLDVKFPMKVVVQWAGFSPDGKTILTTAATGGQRRNIYYFQPGVDSLAKPWLATDFDEVTPRFSPDGKWIAYVSDESNISEVYVRPFPGPGARAQISNGGGDEPVWSRDGKRIFYRNGSKLIVADVTFGAGGAGVGSRRPAGNVYSPASALAANYDIEGDGRMLVPRAAGGEGKLVVIANWLTEARRKIREAKGHN